MNRNLIAYIAAITLVTGLSIPAQLLAQQPSYKLIDVGTFGGPQSYLNDGNDGNNSATALSNRGTLAGWADTPTPDPFPAFCFEDDCFVSHAFQWRARIRTDLGALTDGMSSQANWISASGLISGVSENGDIDPLISGLPQIRAVLWRNGGITDLGTLPNGGYESFAAAVNSRGQVVGNALNTVPDEFSMAAPGFATTQTRAFLWQNGTMQDLGTLGTGTDAMAQFINERGQVVGWSYTSSAPNTSCPFFLPLALGSFIWDEKNGMRDLGTLGGTCALATGVNNAGIVIGDNINDEPTERAFLWENGSIRDLGGTIGGNQTTAEALNQAGQVAGVGTLAGELFYHATLWKRLGEITDLGTVDQDPCSFSSAINSKAQIVGASLPGCAFDSNTRAFLWQDGSIFDLNTLIPPGASLHLQWARDINDRGEIAGTGLDAEGNAHDFLLMPCGANGPSECQEEVVGAIETTQAIRAPLTHGHQFGNPAHSIRRMLRRRLGPLPHILTRKGGLVNSSQTPVTKTNDSTGQLDDGIATHDRAEVAASFGSGSPATAATNSCPAVRCSLHHTQGSVCGVRLCHIPGVVQPIYKGYDLTYRRVCFYGC